jgi:hypothetical protein
MKWENWQYTSIYKQRFGSARYNVIQVNNHLTYYDLLLPLDVPLLEPNELTALALLQPGASLQPELPISFTTSGALVNVNSTIYQALLLPTNPTSLDLLHWQNNHGDVTMHFTAEGAACGLYIDWDSQPHGLTYLELGNQIYDFLNHHIDIQYLPNSRSIKIQSLRPAGHVLVLPVLPLNAPAS